MRRRGQAGAGARRSAGPSAVAALAVITVIAITQANPAPPSAEATIDFTKLVAATPAANIGFTATTFGVDGPPLPINAANVAALGRLQAGSVRIHLAPDATGNIVAAAGGTATGVSAAQWMSTYRQLGVELTVVVNLNQRDALAVLNYLRAGGYNVHRYIVGNEFDANSKSNVSVERYLALFRQIAAAMRAIDPTLQIGGPATAYFGGLTEPLVRGLLDGPADQRASFIDFHGYGAGDKHHASAASAVVYTEQIAQLRRLIADPSVGVEVGEYNMNWGDDPANNTGYHTAWVASALGSILSSGAVGFEYGDISDATGLVSAGEPKPSYWGLGMFTGASLFRHFGVSAVATTSTDPRVHVYASTNGKNVVVVNTGPASALTARLTGYSRGSAAVWQTTRVTPKQLSDVKIGNGQLQADLPRNSVTTFVLADG